MISKNFLLSSFFRLNVKNCLLPKLKYAHYHSNRTSLVRIGRAKYARMYPTLVVNSDGSTYTIRHHEPRQIITLPFDTSGFTPEELKAYKMRRKVKPQEVHEEDYNVAFNLDRYSHLWKKK